MLHVKSITYRVGDRTLFERASAHVPEGKRVGLVGPNGSGKTTLLRLAMKEAELDGGSIDIRAKCSIGTVAQDAPSGTQTPIDAVLASDRERTLLLAEAESCETPERIAQIHTRLADIDAHSAPARAAVILAGLGLDEDMQKRPLDNLSGGWKMRVALASALFREPDLLLLDEPTNHLDLESVLWLESYLLSYPNTLLLVSHDRDLLNRVAEQILHIDDNGSLSMYTGGFDAFVKVRAQQAVLQEAAARKQESERKHLQSFVDRFKAKASKAKQAQSRVKMLEKMQPVQAITRGRLVSFNFPNPEVKPSPLIKLDGIQVGYDESTPILDDLHLSVFADDRVALLGANGNGKTTLARLICEELKPFFGQVVSSSKLKVGYFAQNHLEKLDGRLTTLEQMRSVMPEQMPDKDVRAWVGRFGFAQQRAEVSIKNLSGGEKTRLALAILAWQRPNLMILDEPTNHLDVDAREALIRGLNEYDGAIILISHDRRLIESTVDQLWLVEDGTCKQYFGDMEDYHKLLLSKRQVSKKAERAETSGDMGDRISRKDTRKQAADARAKIAPLKKAAAEAETILEKLTCEKDQIDSKLSDPSIYEGQTEQVADLTRRQRELDTLIAAAEEKWLEVQAHLEEAEAID